MTEEQHFRRSTDVIENELRNINKRLETMQEAMLPALNKIALMEERHAQADNAIGRAFKEIKELEDKVDTNKKEDDGAHTKYNWYIAFVYGVVASSGVFMVYTGKDMLDTLRETVKTTASLSYRVETLEKKPAGHAP